MLVDIGFICALIKFFLLDLFFLFHKMFQPNQIIFEIKMRSQTLKTNNFNKYPQLSQSLFSKKIRVGREEFFLCCLSIKKLLI